MCLLISPFASQNAAISGENVQFQCTVLLNVIKKQTFLTLVNCLKRLFYLCIVDQSVIAFIRSWQGWVIVYTWRQQNCNGRSCMLDKLARGTRRSQSELQHIKNGLGKWHVDTKAYMQPSHNILISGFEYIWNTAGKLHNDIKIDTPFNIYSTTPANTLEYVKSGAFAL